MAANQTVTKYGTTYFSPDVHALGGHTKTTLGLSFPIGKGKVAGGFFKKKTGKNLIKDAVSQLLRTERGERVMLPKFGCNLRKFLFQPLTEELFEAIKHEIMYSIDKYIVGARLKKLLVFPFGELGPAGGNSLKVVLVMELVEEDLTMFDVEVIVK